MSFSETDLHEAQATVGKGGLRKLATAFRKCLREPLVQFILIGAVLFGLYRGIQQAPTQARNPKQIQLTMDDLRQLDLYFQSQWRRQPTPEELTGLIENKIREEILYREALNLGLDKDDTIVKRRMAQKMEFIAEDVANAHEPTAQELKDWFARNEDRFALPSRVTFHHLYFSPDRRGQRTREDAGQALMRLAGKPEDWPQAGKLADPFMFQDYYGDRPQEQLAKDFGPGFAQAVFQLKPGLWQGPVESGYGWHLVWIDSVTPGRVPQFEEVEAEVRTAYMGAQKTEAWDRSYKEMRKQYQVLLPRPPEISQKAP